MSDDIFADWKNKKFVVTKNFVYEHSLTPQFELLIVLAALGFWAEHVEDLDQWCKDNNAKREGMTVLIPDQKTLTLFALRWV